MYKTKLHKTSKFLCPHIYRSVNCEMNVVVFFKVFINHLPKIHRGVLRKITIDLLYFWDIYDVNLWEKLVITVKLCFIETRLKQGYDLQSYLVKTTRETINVLTIAEVFCKKGVLKIWKKLQQKPCACGL